jgi:hypothetical protein
MKSSDNFKKTIEAYIKQQAETDPLFAPCLEKPGKNIDDCCTYILNWVQASKCNGFTDAEIYGQAIHYYQEDNIDIGKPINCKVVVNHEPEPVVLTEEEKQAARQAAIEEEKQAARQAAIEEEIKLQQAKLHAKKPAVKKEPAVTEQASLF